MNPYDDPGFREFSERVHRDLLPKLEDSSVVASLLPEGEVDVKFAIELGLSIMLDKPIIAVVRPGVHIPEKLARVVDRFVEGDLKTDEDARRVGVTIQQLMKEMFDD